MKKLYKLLLICLLILSGGMALKAQNVDDTFSIESKEDLITFADLVENNKSLNARLYADIDLEGGYWNTICETALYYNSYSNDYGYSGTFDGNGHVIKNFKVKSSTTADASAGLFGTVCGTIKNLGVENFTFEDGGEDIRAAAIVGQLITTGGKISNCYVKNATITPGEHVTGGIAGCVYDGTIENCYVVNSNINGSSGRYGYIVGDSRGDKSSTDRPGTVTNCYSDNTPLISDRKGNLSSVENKSAAQFASGEIAYLLQGEQQTDIWGQNIDNGETVQTYPVFSDAKVYKIYNSGCTHYGEFIYSNDANAEFYHEHSFTEDSNGFCTLCNGYEAAELVDGVYHIGNLGQLMWFANNVNTAHKVLLTADITIDNSVVWKPIGLQDDVSNSSIFNGDGHTITFENTNEGSVFGLFNSYNYSIIENLYLAGSITCNTTDNVGALVNSAYRTTIRNVISYVEVTNIGSGRAGGLAGQFGGQHSGELYSLIENCAVYADVTGNVAGGIIGHGWSGNQYYDIKNVAYVGDVTGSERQAAVIAYHGNNSSATKCKFENIYYCEKDALGFVGGGGNNYDLGTDVAAMTAAQFASGEVAYLLQGEQATQVWGQNIDNGETVQAYPVFGGAKIYKTSCGDNYYYSNANVEHSFNDNGFCNTCGNCEPAELVDNYYNISNAGNLVWFSKHVNDDNFSANAKLMNDIEMNAVQWTPIGTSDAYNGTFDGQGHTINNLWHNTGVADGGREGLFTLIGSNGVVTNVTLNNATIWGSSPYGLNGTGGIAVRNEGCITNTMVTNSSIQQGAYEYLGGIAGWNKGSITNCAVINSTLTRRWGGANSGTMGGITQTNSGSVTNCYTYGCMFNNGNNLNSAIVAKENAAVNSYYYTTDNVADAAETAKTKEQFASGEVAYLLQGEQTTQVWGQNIDNGETVQNYPIISDAKVYKHTFNGVTLYSNHKTLKAGGKCGDNLYWNVIDYVLTIYGTGAMWDYNYSSNKAPWLNLNPTPKSLVLKEGITHIGDSAFSGFTGSLTIPNSVTSIGEGAFSGCSSFTGDLTIGNSVKSIGDWAFADCRGFNGSLTIPNSVTAIGSSAFRDCSGFTGSLTIPNSVTAIGNDAFRNCSGFTGDLTIPNSITTIGNYAFYGCSGFNGSLTIPNSITTIGNSAFSSCSGFNGSLTIPNSVTTIGNYAFKNCSGFNGSLTIPNSVMTIGDYAFSGCSSFTEVYSLAETAPTLGTEAFPMFKDINPNTTLYYPTSGEQSYNAKGWFNYFSNRKAFNGKCGDNLYWYVDVNNTLTIFGTGAMYDYDNSDNKAPWRSLNPAPTSLVLEEGITHIGNSAFYDCEGFTEVYSFAVTAPTLGKNAFSDINSNAILYYPVSSYQSYDENGWFNYFPYEANGKCGDNLYWYVDENNTLTIFGTGAMYDYGDTSNRAPWRSLNPAPTSLVLEEGITHIGNYAFDGCSGFDGSLTIPNSVTTIGNSAFQNCSGFTEVYSLAETAPTLGGNAFKNINENAILYYPASSYQSYDENGWFNYFPYEANGKCGDNLYWYVDENDTLTIFGTGAMYDYGDTSNKAPWRSLKPAPTSLVMEEGITHIGNNAFYKCEGFTGSLTIPNSVTTIGKYAFYNCNKFTGSLTIPNSVTNIGEGAFYKCEDFNGDLTIGNSVTTIGVSAFEYCSGLTGSLTIPNSVTNIGNSAFKNCSSFTGSLTIPNSVTSIENYAFRYCSGFTGSLTIPNSVKSIGYYAFQNCSGFTGSLTIPNSVTTIGNYAFQNCSGFTEVYSLAETAPTLGKEAFPMFKDINPNTTLYYPTSGEKSYNAKGWFEYFPQYIGFNGKCGDNLYWYVDVNSTLTIFGTGAMYDYDNSDNKAPWRSLKTAPESLVLEEGITHIGNLAFYYCNKFTGSLTIPNSVKSIGNYAFALCSKFTGSLTIPNSVKSIGNHAFFQCTKFNGSLTIGNSVTTIGVSAFESCNGFTGSLTIPNSVKNIGNYAFYQCTKFNGSLTIGNSVTTIGNEAFRGCYGFTGSLTIPNSVTSIGNYAFRECSSFTGSLTIPNSVTSIGNYAFYQCSSFTEIFFYRDTNPTISAYAFSSINANAKVYAPVIWKSFSNIPEDKLVKMATFVGEQSGWVFPEGMKEVSADDHVAINAPMVISGQQSADSLSVKSFGLCGKGTTVNGRITIEDGGQLYCEVARGEVTVKKEILGYQQSAVSGQQSESESKWYTIASPLKDAIQITHDSTLLTPNSDYDLYRYDEPSYTWQNAKNSANNGFNTIDPGRGYLYANAENTTLKFKGDINTETVTYNLTAKSDVLNGFHLIGNPFTHNITFAHLNATEGASLVNGYYVLNGEGAWGATLGSNEDDVIKVGQGVLVKATAEGTLAISRQPSAVSRQRSGKGQQLTAHSSLQLTVSNAKYSDRAFVVFDKGVGLDKMNHENEDIPLLYIPMEDADYAIAMMDMNVNEIPVNFETNVMGEYTISLRQENCEFDELYLLDKETDEKVNILEQDYTFIATSSENPERFILMKDAQGSQLEAHSHFAYINNGDIVIYDIEGDADIKIFDALGRCVYHGESSDETTRIANGYSSGVYMIQKVDDNGVKVQKVMID